MTPAVLHHKNEGLDAYRNVRTLDSCVLFCSSFHLPYANSSFVELSRFDFYLKTFWQRFR